MKLKETYKSQSTIEFDKLGQSQMTELSKLMMLCILMDMTTETDGNNVQSCVHKHMSKKNAEQRCVRHDGKTSKTMQAPKRTYKQRR